ncbi:GNAT family N-acetyltransferase [Acuticoccus mangrovi]|uniref:GNAT family N-acetyltransferase n=1 Tax=Acuticoccus mangrovi TaxID=2796142 RepID=A0A934ISC9_9HYPH|nr:GNAT family N-acetyltransferase [Acuticoccus mangrovi]MBJ3777165.1 GNAT family N-acetyltransferase [Acuticoccus mangrovi]
MLPFPPRMRLARTSDGPALADLVNFAGEGLPLHLWKELAGPDEDPWEIGAARQVKRAEDGQMVVIEEAGTVVAAMNGYPICGVVEIGEAMPPIFRPLQMLENMVVGTWYLNVVATYPRARGRGLGSRLLAYAEGRAVEEGLAAVSIIVADENVGARRLYERLGYGEIARADIVKDGWDNPSSQWILLKKAIEA